MPLSLDPSPVGSSRWTLFSKDCVSTATDYRVSWFSFSQDAEGFGKGY